MPRAELAIERGGAAGSVDGDGEGEVELVDIAGADEGMDLVNAVGILLFGKGQG